MTPLGAVALSCVAVQYIGLALGFKVFRTRAMKWWAMVVAAVFGVIGLAAAFVDIVVLP